MGLRTQRVLLTTCIAWRSCAYLPRAKQTTQSELAASTFRGMSYVAWGLVCLAGSHVSRAV